VVLEVGAESVPESLGDFLLLGAILLGCLILIEDKMLRSHIQVVLVLWHRLSPFLDDVHIQIVLVTTRLDVCVEGENHKLEQGVKLAGIQSLLTHKLRRLFIEFGSMLLNVLPRKPVIFLCRRLLILLLYLFGILRLRHHRRIVVLIRLLESSLVLEERKHRHD
jgi:hypothetical protein